MKPSLRKSLFMSVAALSLTCIVCISGAFVFMEYYYFQRDVQEVRNEYLDSQKEMLRSEVDRAVDYIFYMKLRTDRRLRTAIKGHVEEAYAIASNLYEQYGHTMSRDEVMHLIMEALRPIRFNEGRGYFFAADLKGIMLLHPIQTNAEGKDYSGWKDEDGVYIFQTAIDIATRQGQGFFSYKWFKPGIPDKQFRKISYVKMFKPLGFYVGSGEYVDNVTRDIQHEVLARLEKVRFGKRGYLFVGQWDGVSLAGPAKGRNMWKLTDNNGVKVVQELVQAARKGGGYVEYMMPELDGVEQERKISYTRSVEDWQWYVGAGVFVDDINARIASMRDDLNDRLYQHMLMFTLLFLTLAGGIFLVSGRLSGRLGRTVGDFLTFFDTTREGPASIDPEAQYYREFENIAQAANEMIARRERIEDELGLSEKRFKLLFNVISDAIYVYGIGPDGRRGEFFEFNDAACQQVGYSCEELETMTVEDIDENESILPIERRFGPDGLAIFETKHITRSGRTIPVEVHARLFELGGQPTVMIICRDISAHMEAERELQISLEKYKALFEIFPFGITVTDEQGEILEVNQESERLLGISANNHVDRSLDSDEWKIVGTKGLELPFQEYPASVALAEQRVIRDREIGVVKPDADTVWLSVTAAPIPLKGYGVVVGYTDVTSRKLAEQELVEREDHLAGLFKTMPTGLFVLENRVIKQVNDQLCEMSGYTREEMVGQTTRMLYQSDEYYNSIGDSVYGQIQEQGISRVEAELRHKSGRVIYVYAQSVLLESQEESVSIITTILDITDSKKAEEELKASEAKFRRLVEDMGDRFCLFQHDLEGTVTYLSPSASSMMGVDLEKIVGGNWRAALEWEPGATEKAEEHIRQLVDGDVDSATYELRFRHLDGLMHTLEVTEHLLLDETQVPTGVEGILVDVSERVRSQEELQEYGDKLEEMVRDRTMELTAIVEELRGRNQESAAMARFGDLLQVCESDEESYGIVASICTQLFAGQSGYLALLDESAISLIAVAGFGNFDWQDVDFEMHDCWALRRGRPHIIVDPALDPSCPHMGKMPSDASICMPVEARGEYLGLLHIQLTLPMGLSEEKRLQLINSERDLARRVAELYSLSLANVRLREKLRAQSIRDGLTGLYNRRHMEESLAREIDRARRRETNLGVILMDVDHFKKFNDTHGHEAGDEVLRKLGEFLLEHTRGEDIPCRYGGEELLVIMPDCPARDCRKRAEQIREGVAALEVRHGDTKLGVTISLGAATYPTHGESYEEVVSAADAALYKAKEKGRNRVESA